MKKYLKHLIAVAVCLVLGVGLLAGCTENLGTELTADAELTAAKTQLVESIDNTFGYEDGYQISIQFNTNMEMDGTEISLKLNSSVTSNTEKAKITSTINMVANSKSMESSSAMKLNSFIGKVGDDYVKYDLNAEQKYVFDDKESMEMNIPGIDENVESVMFLGMFGGVDLSILGNLDFEAFDENDNVSYKIYSTGENDYNLVLNTTNIIMEQTKTVCELKLFTVDGKIEKLVVASTLYENVREEGETEPQWNKVGTSSLAISANYTFKDFELADSAKIQDFELVDSPSEIGSIDDLPLF